MKIDKSTKLYGKLVSARSEFEVFRMIERMDDKKAKEVLLIFAVNKIRIEENEENYTAKYRQAIANS